MFHKATESYIRFTHLWLWWTIHDCCENSTNYKKATKGWWLVAVSPQSKGTNHRRVLEPFLQHSGTKIAYVTRCDSSSHCCTYLKNKFWMQLTGIWWLVYCQKTLHQNITLKIFLLLIFSSYIILVMWCFTKPNYIPMLYNILILRRFMNILCCVIQKDRHLFGRNFIFF